MNPKSPSCIYEKYKATEHLQIQGGVTRIPVYPAALIEFSVHSFWLNFYRRQQYTRKPRRADWKSMGISLRKFGMKQLEITAK